MRPRRARGSIISRRVCRSTKLSASDVAIMSASQPGSAMFMAKRCASSGMERSSCTQRSNRSSTERMVACVWRSAAVGSNSTRARTLMYGRTRMNSTISTRRRPCASADEEPSGIESRRPTAISTPTGRKSFKPGSSISGSRWVSPMTVWLRCWASCTANSEASRPTKIGETMRGKITISRRGNTSASIRPFWSASMFGTRYSSSVRCESAMLKFSSSSFQSSG